MSYDPYDPDYERNRDSRLIRAAELQAWAAREAADAAKEQVEALNEQNALIAQRLAFEMEVQRARDLGVSHRDYKARLKQHSDALVALRNAQLEHVECLERYRTQMKLAHRSAWASVLCLVLKNLGRWFRHPISTRGEIRSQASAIHREACQVHRGYQKAFRDLQAVEAQLNAAKSHVATTESRL